MHFRKILVIQLRQLGDILLTTPCLREIKRQLPSAHLTFLSHAMGRKILETNPHIDELWTYQENDSLLQAWQLLSKVRKSGFDLVLDFMNNPRSAVFTRFSGAKQRMGFRSARTWAYNTVCEPPKEPCYIVREKFLLLQACGFSPEAIELVLKPTPEDTAKAEAFVNAHPGFSSAPIRVALSPTHRIAIRKWPGERYVQLAEKLVEARQASVTWLWGPGEEEEIDLLRSQCRVETHKAPMTTFREMAALLTHHDLFIGNSNGLSHVAVAANIPTLQLHGHTSTVAWSPMNEKHRGIQSPDYGKVSGKADLSAIAVEDVWKTLAAWKPEFR